MSGLVRSVALAACVGLVGLAGAARAQSAKAAAEAAFRKGKELIAIGKVDEACAAFEESERLDPQLGTQYNLALCYEQAGKLASAWVNYTEVAAKDARGGRKDEAARRARALEPRLTRVIVVVQQSVSRETVQIGSIDVGVLAGTPVPLDPGNYDVVVSAPGYERYDVAVDVRGEGKTTTVTIPMLTLAEHPAPPPRPEAPHRDPKRRRFALIVGGAGVIATGVGLWFGAQASDLKSQAITACGGQLMPCAQAGFATAMTDIASARDKATIADVAIGVGAAALVTGVILYATAPQVPESYTLAPVIGPDRVGLAFGASF